MRLIRTVMFILRVIFGLVYILSGFFKLMDPVGTGLKLAEYFNVLHLGFLHGLSVPAGIGWSTAEFVTGIAILMCVRMRFFSWVGLCMESFFTILTLYIALFDPIADCGCFGDIVHLTNWQTFYKNIILLACAIPIFIFRGKFKPVAPVAAEWCFIAVFAVIGVVSSIWVYFTRPIIEFGDFKAGSDITLAIEKGYSYAQTDNTFIYQKDGTRKEFTLDNLPDSTWTYVETVEKGNASGETETVFDFTITDAGGGMLTSRITGGFRPRILVVAYRPENLKARDWEYISDLADSLLSIGRLYVLVPADNGYVAGIEAEYPSLAGRIAYGDYRTLISLSRPNGGIVYFKEGIVIRKWGKGGPNPQKIKETLTIDSEELTAKVSIGQRLFYEMSILLIFLIIVMFRYICGIIYGIRRKPTP